MKMNKLAPWNWFNTEEDRENRSLPVRRRDTASRFDHPMLQLHNEIDRMFEDFFGGFDLPDFGLGKTWDSMTRTGLFKPNLDISETDKEYNIAVELPGVDEKNIELELTGNALKIKGEKKQETEKKDKNYHCMERSYGSFQRVLSLPDDADPETISAEYKNGIMTIKVPRKPELKPDVKKIEIKAG